MDGASTPMARRLAKRTGMCVVCSVNVPLELADLALDQYLASDRYQSLGHLI